MNNLSPISSASFGTRLDRFFSSLVAGLIGDAMGSATEQLTPVEVVARFGRLTTFRQAGEGTFASGRTAGLLTDDGAQMLGMAQLLVEHRGAISAQLVAQVILDWADDPEVLRRFAGPSTRKAIMAMREGKTPEEAGRPEPTANDFRNSNGSAMKVAPAGLAFADDIEAAVNAAAIMCVPTHNSDIAYSGAGAIAAATAMAARGDNGLEAVAQAAIEGARLGLEMGKIRAVPVPGPAIAARIEVARDIALDPNRSRADRITRLNDVIGGGLPVAEAVPLAVGLFLACDGHPMDCVIEAVNLGNDSDTVATMAGAIGGAYAGSAQLDAELVSTLISVNEIDVASTARALVALSQKEV